MGHIHSIPYKPWSLSLRIRRYFMLGISIFASRPSYVKFDNRGNILEALRRTFLIKSSSFFSSRYQIVTQYSRWGRTREINKYLNETILRKLYDLWIRSMNLLAFFTWLKIWLENFNFESIITPTSFSLSINFKSCIWPISIFNIVYILVSACPKRSTLHFDVLNFNRHFSDRDIKMV